MPLLWQEGFHTGSKPSWGREDAEASEDDLAACLEEAYPEDRPVAASLEGAEASGRQASSEDVLEPCSEDRLDQQDAAVPWLPSSERDEGLAYLGRDHLEQSASSGSSRPSWHQGLAQARTWCFGRTDARQGLLDQLDRIG